MTDLAGARWHKSIRSGSNRGNCAEVADDLPRMVAVRNTKNRDDGTLIFPPAEWTAFAGAEDGEFDLR
jgi:hypothetical protein